jgi:ubiquinone/menaquinone biosynthesis C-methylase UbiE
MEVEQAAMLDLLPNVDGLDALDVGCGTGRYARLLLARGARVVGVDLSDAMLGRARAGGARLIRADLRALPLRGASFDIVVSGLTLGDVAELDDAMAEMARVLRSGGRLVYSVVHPIGAQAGWARTFDESGRTFEVETCWHPIDAHANALAAAGLEIERQREPVLRQPNGTPVPAALVLRAARRP